MYKRKLIKLFNYIYEMPEEDMAWFEKKDFFNELLDKVNVFSEYINCVSDMESKSNMYSGGVVAFERYREIIQEVDKKRKKFHEKIVEDIRDLNHMFEIFNMGTFVEVDLEDKQQVADYAAKIVYDLYTRRATEQEILKITLDDMVNGQQYYSLNLEDFVDYR